MRSLLLLCGILLALAAPAASAAPGQPIELTFGRAHVSMVVGQRITLDTSIANTGTEPAEPLLAHLNVVSLTSAVYVDPEDWSSERSQEVDALEPGENKTLSWGIQAVSAGSFDIYVVLLPNGASTAGRGPLVVSPPVHADVAARRALNASGALPVVITVPALLGFGAAAVRYRHRKTR
jgi:hypothetical protein